MNERKGYIYLITNDINDNKYVGQTSRNIQERFKEHIWDSKNVRHPSKLHNAIHKYGKEHFKIQEIEFVPLDQLDEREKYWINKYNTVKNGYNISLGGQGIPRLGVKFGVVENDLVFESKAEAARMISKLTSWDANFISEKLGNIVNTDQTFCDYHFIYLPEETECSDELTLEDWIITLNIRYQGQKIHCIQLNLDFDTIGEAARYILDNNLYIGQSKMPIQSIISSLGQHLKRKTDFLACTKGNLQFEKLPGTTKRKVNNTLPQKIYCPELNKTFETQVEAAHFMIDNNYWKNIKFKTAKLRVSDVVRGIFPDYKGYTFQKV